MYFTWVDESIEKEQQVISCDFVYTVNDWQVIKSHKQNWKEKVPSHLWAIDGSIFFYVHLVFNGFGPILSSDLP